MRRLKLIALALVGLACATGSSAQSADPPSATMIFFDWGKPEIQRDYIAKLDEAAAALLRQPGQVVLIEAHSDRSGSAAANREASLRRAKVVRDYLVGRGVPARSLSIKAYGEAQPLVATEDGVREPQNRRVDLRLVPNRLR